MDGLIADGAGLGGFTRVVKVPALLGVSTRVAFWEPWGGLNRPVSADTDCRSFILKFQPFIELSEKGSIRERYGIRIVHRDLIGHRTSTTGYVPRCGRVDGYPQGCGGYLEVVTHFFIFLALGGCQRGATGDRAGCGRFVNHLAVVAIVRAPRVPSVHTS